MEDVRGLFLGALAIRRGCLAVMALCLVLLALLKTDFKRIFPSALCAGTSLFFAASLAVAAIISTDFTRYFILFHRMFFKNDFWILNPETDMLINIVPEGFFRDTVLLIGSIYFLSVLVILGVCIFFIRRYRKIK